MRMNGKKDKKVSFLWLQDIYNCAKSILQHYFAANQGNLYTVCNLNTTTRCSHGKLLWNNVMSSWRYFLFIEIPIFHIDLDFFMNYREIRPNWDHNNSVLMYQFSSLECCEPLLGERKQQSRILKPLEIRDERCNPNSIFLTEHQT